MGERTVSTGFRHASWFTEHNRERTLAFLRELGAVHTMVDAPQGFANSVPLARATPHPRCALRRLHGRNADTWDIECATSASDRFNDDCTADEIAALAGDVRQLGERIAETHVVFNNNMEDQGQRNARSLIDGLAALRLR